MYIQFKDDEGSGYGSCEVFYIAQGDEGYDEVSCVTPGWFWWACFPGCMPDGELNGPFDTGALAIDDAQEN